MRTSHVRFAASLVTISKSALRATAAEGSEERLRQIGWQASSGPSSSQIRRSTARTFHSTKPSPSPPNLIRESRLPIFGGLGTDVDGMRAVMTLAERGGGVVDHALSERAYRNLRVLSIERLAHDVADGSAQPRRPLHHRRQRHQQNPSALLRAHRLQRSVDVFRRPAEADRHLSRRRPGSVGGARQAHWRRPDPSLQDRSHRRNSRRDARDAQRAPRFQATISAACRVPPLKIFWRAARPQHTA